MIPRPNRPVHEVLEFAWPYLYPRGYSLRICYAIAAAARAGKISDAEADTATDLVQQRVKEYAGEECAFLRSAAMINHVFGDCPDIKAPEYIEFRDKWLRSLIKAEKAAYETRTA